MILMFSLAVKEEDKEPAHHVLHKDEQNLKDTESRWDLNWGLAALLTAMGRPRKPWGSEAPSTNNSPMGEQGVRDLLWPAKAVQEI